ncbi:hypothetical protein [Streptomyces sp. CH6]|uniref:hypothetical protein n=1 Tax=unclassified Streptomyces TaxID=2593676 RepID=UPI003D03688A
MSRTPDRIAVASLDTHRLIVTVDKRGAAETHSNLSRETTAAVLRQLADEVEPTRRGGLNTPSEAPLLAGTSAAEAFASFENFNARAAAMSRDDDEHQGAEMPPVLTPEDVRAALAFNEGEHDQALYTLRDVLLGVTATPAQALAAARLILAAHARQIADTVDAERIATKDRFGLTRGTRGLLTGYSSARKAITTYADRLAAQ